MYIILFICIYIFYHILILNPFGLRNLGSIWSGARTMGEIRSNFVLLFGFEKLGVKLFPDSDKSSHNPAVPR
jgi:hypothetical protein